MIIYEQEEREDSTKESNHTVGYTWQPTQLTPNIPQPSLSITQMRPEAKIDSQPDSRIHQSKKMTLVVRSMATQKPISTTNKTVSSKKVNSTSAPAGIKLLTRVEQLRLLTKAEKAGLLSAAEKAGLSLSSIEKYGLLSKAEELGVLSAATDPATPATLFTVSLGLLALGPLFVYLVPEQYPWEIGVQVAVALLSVLGGSAAFAASNFVSDLQKSN